MSNIVQIEFNNLCENCKYMGVRYCKDSHCEVEPFCKLSGIERKLCVSENCPLIYREAKHDSELLDKVAEKLKAEMIEEYPRNIFGVKAPTPFAHFSYRGVCNILDKVIVQMKAEVSE